MTKIVQTKNELNTEFCNVKFILNDNIVLLTWKKFCCFENYRIPTMFASDMLKKFKNSNLIIDARNGFEDDKADIDWGFSVLLPSMAKSNCKKCVFIMNEVSDIDGEIDLWTKEFMKYFVVGKVLTYADAVKFIQTNITQE